MRQAYLAITNRHHGTAAYALRATAVRIALNRSTIRPRFSAQIYSL